jgi:hypothetical protein
MNEERKKRKESKLCKLDIIGQRTKKKKEKLRTNYTNKLYKTA